MASAQVLYEGMPDHEDWTSRAPMRSFYGENDIDVHPDDSQRAVEGFRQWGGSAELVNLGPHDHNASVFHAVPCLQQWFGELAQRGA